MKKTHLAGKFLNGNLLKYIEMRKIPIDRFVLRASMDDKKFTPAVKDAGKKKYPCLPTLY